MLQWGRRGLLIVWLFEKVCDGGVLVAGAPIMVSRNRKRCPCILVL